MAQFIELGSIMTLDRTEFVTVMCTGQFIKFDMAVNALREARIPHQVQAETSTGLKLAMPVTAAAGPGRLFTVLVPAEYESKAQEVLSDLPFEVVTNPGPWDFEPQPNAKKWLKIWIIGGLLLALSGWLVEIISRVFG